MKNRVFALIFTLQSIGFSMLAQQNSLKFSSSYPQDETDDDNLELALFFNQGLGDERISNEQRIQTLIFDAEIEHYKGNIREALLLLMEAKNLSNHLEIPFLEAKTAAVLASFFRELSLYSQSMYYFKQIEKASLAITDPTQKLQVKIYILWERVYHKMEEGEFEEAIHLLNQAEKNIAQKEIQNDAFRLISAINSQLLGTCQLKVKDYSGAKKNFEASLARLTAKNVNELCLAYIGLAEYYLIQGELDLCNHYLIQIDPYKDKIMKITVEGQILDIEATYYDAVGNSKMTRLALQEKIALHSVQYSNSQVVSSAIIERLEKKICSIQRYELLFWWTVSIAIALLIWLVYNYNSEKKSKRKEKTEPVLPVVKKDNLNLLKSLPTQETTFYSESEISIALETEMRLVRELAALEKNNFFLEKDMTLGKLTNQLNSNQRYVSHIIRKYRNQTFNDYLQQKKIHYLIDCIQADPTLLEYKFAYFAQLVGFSSHSQFTIAFKTIMGQTPSQYIETLKNNNKETQNFKK